LYIELIVLHTYTLVAIGNQIVIIVGIVYYPAIGGTDPKDEIGIGQRID